MKFTETKLVGAFVIDIEPIEDERGFFARSWCQKEFSDHGIDPALVQCNISYNKNKGTLRGMHYQSFPYQEGKIVRCTHGGIYDVIIDLRENSPSFCQWHAVELTAMNRRMLYVPENFAHGFLTLTDNAEVFYQMTHFYSPGAASGVRWDDPAFDINWPATDIVISERDRSYPDFILGK